MESVLAGAHDLGMYVHVAKGAWMARAGMAGRGLGRGYMPGESQGINTPCVVTDAS